ncbi:hypothetical protein CERSUDRAFT_133820 [Gelatoporia subvermispora B]|uniref:mRNA decay factor PAT1 domain-containing protein n=1 Tax=Ceriporiopsis subvermispora (strain B) TaxID=914234 RepID=M2PR48_CERS8|nr:hypothetical protein CERSUDRAFT_133820 [Gelatoporia subvermispora B]
MSFFGFDEKNLESEKRRFLEDAARGAQEENLAVYTWGEDSYDGLGDALQEGDDELNDETFGGAGEVGKDFDFSGTALPGDSRTKPSEPANAQSLPRYQVVEQPATRTVQSNQPSRTNHSLESVWDDKSPFSVLPRMNGADRTAEHAHQPAKASTFATAPSQHSNLHQSIGLSLGGNAHKGVRTLEEIEAEMLAAAAARQMQLHAQAQAEAQAQAQAQTQALPQSLSQAQLTQAQLSQAQMRAQPPRQGTPQHGLTPPPRMHPHSQSPRFHQQQQQHQIHILQLQQLQQQQQQQRLLELQEQRERQQQQQLRELQQQLRMEELERQRQLRLQQMQAGAASHLQSQAIHQRHGSLSPSLSDRNLRRGQSPAMMNPRAQMEAPFQQSMQYLPQDIQLQQRLLAEMAQAEFMNNMQAGVQSEREAREEREMQEVLRQEAMRKIMEAEKSEEKRRRKLAKIAQARYNDLMTQSDKDFITRIQVSQLVTQDPYADDFYAQVYSALLRSRLGVQPEDERVLKFGSAGGVGLGFGQKGPGRRQTAMQRMEAQVERIVQNARLREKEKTSLNSLQGALGKTSGRSYKAAPRQLLQVDSTSPSLSPAHAHISKADVTPPRDGAGATREAANIGRRALRTTGDGEVTVRKEPLTQREALMILERLYDLVLDIEQHKREEVPTEEEEAHTAWSEHLSYLTDQLWKGLQVSVILETSEPHPFVSLLTPIKGKRLLPRVARHLGSDQLRILLTLILACFTQLDVVKHAPILDSLHDTRERREVEDQTQTFVGSVVQTLLPLIAKTDMHMTRAYLGILTDRPDAVNVLRTGPGIALITLFLSRVAVLKQNMATATEASEIPPPEELAAWQEQLDHLFEIVGPHILTLFPSVRIGIVSGLGFANVPNADVLDQPVWQFLASLAVHANSEQQSLLVTALREVILELVSSVHKGWDIDPEERKTRLNNINLFLHALGLDASQITV